MDDVAKRAKRLVYRLWPSSSQQDKEDISQDVVLSFLQHPKSKQLLKHAVIDSLRRLGNHGRSGKLRGEVLCEEGVENAEGKLELEEAMLLRFDTYLKGLNLEDRCMVILRYVWELTEQEVGYCFGMSASSISLRMSRVLALLKEREES